jgi:protein-S-isoprenylcysteine O-methyltransferase Ste14
MNVVYSMLVPALWIAWFIYWRIAALNVKRTMRSEPIRSRLLYMAGPVAGALLLANFGAVGILAEPIWPRTALTFWLGVVIMALGFAFTVWARITLGRNWSATITLKEHHELIQTGPYAWVRHPIYAGALVMIVGTVVVIAEWRGVLALAIVLVSLLIKARREERWMTEYFGPNYVAYRKRVPMLIPWRW